MGSVRVGQFEAGRASRWVACALTTAVIALAALAVLGASSPAAHAQADTPASLVYEGEFAGGRLRFQVSQTGEVFNVTLNANLQQGLGPVKVDIPIDVRLDSISLLPGNGLLPGLYGSAVLTFTGEFRVTDTAVVILRANPAAPGLSLDYRVTVEARELTRVGPNGPQSCEPDCWKIPPIGFTVNVVELIGADNLSTFAGLLGGGDSPAPPPPPATTPDPGTTPSPTPPPGATTPSGGAPGALKLTSVRIDRKLKVRAKVSCPQTSATPCKGRVAGLVRVQPPRRRGRRAKPREQQLAQKRVTVAPGKTITTTFTVSRRALTRARSRSLIVRATTLGANNKPLTGANGKPLKAPSRTVRVPSAGRAR